MRKPSEVLGVLAQFFDKLRRPSDLIMRMGFLTHTVIAADFAATGKLSLKVVKKVVYHRDTHSTPLHWAELWCQRSAKIVVWLGARIVG